MKRSRKKIVQLTMYEEDIDLIMAHYGITDPALRNSAISLFLRDAARTMGVTGFRGRIPDKGSGKRMIPKQDENRVLNEFVKHRSADGTIADFCKTIAERYGYKNPDSIYIWLMRKGAFGRDNAIENNDI